MSTRNRKYILLLFIIYSVILINTLFDLQCNGFIFPKQKYLFSNIYFNRLKLNLFHDNQHNAISSIINPESSSSTEINIIKESDTSLQYLQSDEFSNNIKDEILSEISLKMITFNILAPCYKKVTSRIDKSSQFESEFKELYMERNLNICMELLQTDADIICLQEFWSGSTDLQQLYMDYLCTANKYNRQQPYSLRTLSRTSHWRSRGDSVAIFVKSTRLEIEDVQEILFHDCGDRVALMLLLALHPYPIINNISTDNTDNNSSEKQSYSEVSESYSEVSDTLDSIKDNGLLTSSNSSEGIQLTINNIPQVDINQYCNRNSTHTIPIQRFICVNTHLLFPHNPYSTQIRLREITKILGFIEAYKQKELCASICSRSDVQIPVIIAGDFNGSPRGSVYKYIKSQNFRSTMEEYHKDMQSNSNIINTEINNDDLDDMEKNENIVYNNPCNELEDPSIYYTINENNTLTSNLKYITSPIQPTSSSTPYEYDAVSNIKYNSNKPNIFKWNNWISHKSHLNKNVAVDHIFYLNPSEQVIEKLPPLPDWTNLVWNELLQKIVSEKGIANAKDVFTSFDVDGSSYVTTEEFTNALRLLGFVGENTPCLTNEEIEMLVLSADKNNDGLIDYKEFYDRFWLASIVQTNNNNNSNNNKIDEDSSNSRLLFARSKWLSEKYDSNKAMKLLDDTDKEKRDDKTTELIIQLDTGDEIILLENHNLDNNSTLLANNNTIMNKKSIYNENEIIVASSQIVKNAYSLNNRINVVPLGELSVHSVRIYPEEMEYGIWPSNYTLSDHGMIECIFKAKLNF